MKSKIGICFLTIVIILLALVTIEKINTQRAADNAAIIAQSKDKDKDAKYKEEKDKKESLQTSNEAKNARYCIINDSGMLSVYNGAASEKYFDTGVYFEELPEEVKNKVTNGLYFFNETDLYDFLESYSS
ncbi:MAG: hypothetical protein U0K78_02910 [Agathobacter sp.]|uniref:hypothetical protein n=1 Tax=Agathobacter sp. TaxID=2021311 RepID=UPI00280620C9|nr:hypothetical protein [Agathobacter sp.]MEE1216452.1 hypothetical protein [Agathobacter sp.]